MLTPWQIKSVCRSVLLGPKHFQRFRLHNRPGGGFSVVAGWASSARTHFSVCGNFYARPIKPMNANSIIYTLLPIIIKFLPDAPPHTESPSADADSCSIRSGLLSAKDRRAFELNAKCVLIKVASLV